MSGFGNLLDKALHACRAGSFDEHHISGVLELRKRGNQCIESDELARDSREILDCAPTFGVIR